MTSGWSARLIWDHKAKDIRNDKFINSNDTEYVFPGYGDRLRQEDMNPVIANRLIKGDNYSVIKALLQEGYQEKVDLIYIDPPYLSDSNYHSKIMVGKGESRKTLTRKVFVDTWSAGIDSYLDHIYPLLILMKELLSEKGSIFVHLDWHVSHYVKLLLDEIFSPENFINEIIWCYGGGSNSKRHFHRKHDVIFWYSKGSNYIFNPQYRPYTEKTRQRGLTKVKGDKYSLHNEGALMQDWWTDINKILSPTAKENLKFPTQKPLALLKRIVSAASEPESLVADFYAGSGTTMQACEELGRNWIACDSSDIAIQTITHRMARIQARPFKITEVTDRKVTKPSDNKVTLKKPIIVNYGKNYYSLNIGIDDYIPASRHLNLLEGEALWVYWELIDFWAIDWDYDDKVFKSTVQICRDTTVNNTVPMEYLIFVPKKGKYKIAVKVYDVFGDSIIDTLEIAL